MASGNSVRLDFCSAFDMLDFVQVVCDHVGRMAGLDDESVHWVGVAVRESVINAIKHGNANDEQKRVYVEFTPVDGSVPGIAIRVRDEGPGFDPEDVPDPTAPENLERPCGRGLLLMRHYMNHIEYVGTGNTVVMSKWSLNGSVG